MGECTAVSLAAAELSLRSCCYCLHCAVKVNAGGSAVIVYIALLKSVQAVLLLLFTLRC